MNTQSQEMTFFDRDGHYCVGGDFLLVSQNPCLIARTQAVDEDSLGPGWALAAASFLTTRSRSLWRMVRAKNCVPVGLEVSMGIIV